MATSADELVIGWFGRMGAGKTLNMVKWAVLFSELTGRKIYSQIKINHKNWISFSDFRELEEVRHAIILFDEIHTLFDSRKWDSKLQQKFTYWFTQTRKMYNTIFYTSQTLDQLEKRVRNNTQFVVLCTKDRKRGEMFESFYNTEFGFSQAQFLSRKVFTKPELIYNLYDTRQLINLNFYNKED